MYSLSSFIFVSIPIVTIVSYEQELLFSKNMMIEHHFSLTGPSSPSITSSKANSNLLTWAMRTFSANHKENIILKFYS